MNRAAFFRQTLAHKKAREAEKASLKARGLWFLADEPAHVDPDKGLPRTCPLQDLR